MVKKKKQTKKEKKNRHTHTYTTKTLTISSFQFTLHIVFGFSVFSLFIKHFCLLGLTSVSREELPVQIRSFKGKNFTKQAKAIPVLIDKNKICILLGRVTEIERVSNKFKLYLLGLIY